MEIVCRDYIIVKRNRSLKNIKGEKEYVSNINRDYNSMDSNILTRFSYETTKDIDEAMILSLDKLSYARWIDTVSILNGRWKLVELD